MADACRPVAFVAPAMIAGLRGVAIPGIPPEPFNYRIGIPSSAAGSARFRRAGTNIHIFSGPEMPVTDGIFSVGRNPMYPGIAIALPGFAVKPNQPVDLAMVAAFVPIADRWCIRFEERMAAAAFGPEHQTCRRRTRRWM